MKCPFCIKVCTKCGKILVANNINFNKQKRGKFGLTSQCKICSKKRIKNWYNENKEHCLEKRKEYKNNHKKEISEKNKKYYNENKEHILERNKQWLENNPNYMKQWRCENFDHMKQYNKNNKEKISKRNKKWRENNSDKVFNYYCKRHQLEENQGNGVTKEQWLEMMNFFEWKCAYSGKSFSFHNEKSDRSIDHIIPLNKDGENEIWNLVPMYINYNYSKRDKNMIDWYMEQEFFDIDRLLKIYEWIEYAYKKWGEGGDE